LKSGTLDEAKRKLREVRGKSKKEPGKMDDPSLEGTDENKVGRIQEKTGQAGNVLTK
jgi:uncharacterized protein YjbJ (UPF0337 family)